MTKVLAIVYPCLALVKDEFFKRKKEKRLKEEGRIVSMMEEGWIVFK